MKQDANTPRTLHCWCDSMDGLEIGTDEWARAYIEPRGTCMLEADHGGPHVFTPDSEIGVTFAEVSDAT